MKIIEFGMEFGGLYNLKNDIHMVTLLNFSIMIPVLLLGASVLKFCPNYNVGNEFSDLNLYFYHPIIFHTIFVPYPFP